MLKDHKFQRVSVENIENGYIVELDDDMNITRMVFTSTRQMLAYLRELYNDAA
jgi:hypothetical protein